MPDTVALLFLVDWNVRSLADTAVPLVSGRVVVGPASGGQLKTLISHERMPDGIAIVMDDSHGKRGRIYWTQMGRPGFNDGLVQSAKLDGSDIRTLYDFGEIHTPNQIIFDPIAQKLYVADKDGMRIHQSNTDGTEKEVMVELGDWTEETQIKDESLHCVGVALDCVHSLIYWVQKVPGSNDKGRIFRAGINLPAGESAESRQDVQLLFDKIPLPIDLAIDPRSETLFWTDQGDATRGSRLNRACLFTCPRQSVRSPAVVNYDSVATRLPEAIGMLIYHQEKRIFVTDVSGSVHSFDMDGQDRRKLFEGQGEFNGIALANIDRAVARRLCASA